MSSGEYPIRPGLARAARDEQHYKTRAAFVHALEVLRATGWGVRELARFLKCSPSMICEMRDGKRSVAPWALGGLPLAGKQAFASAFQSLELGEIRTAETG